MKELQVACPYQLILFGARFGSPSEVLALEWDVHMKLGELGFKVRGEWFDIDAADAVSVVDKCAEIYNRKLLTPSQYDGFLTDLSARGESRPKHAPTLFDMEMIMGSLHSASILLTDSKK